MEKEIKITIIVLMGFVLLFVILAYWTISSQKFYFLSQYSCEEIKQSIIDANCLVESKSGMFYRCFTPQEKELSYNLRCNGGDGER